MKLSSSESVGRSEKWGGVGEREKKKGEKGGMMHVLKEGKPTPKNK